jgi:hypothetical protein
LRRLVVAAAGLALMMVAACSPKTESAGADKYVGLDEAIKAWHAEISAAPDRCPAKDGGAGCQTFEVACKAESPITPAESAKGVSAKIVAAMSWEGWNPKQGEYQPGSDFAEFSKAAGKWSRQATGPLNLSTCAKV